MIPVQRRSDQGAEEERAKGTGVVTAASSSSCEDAPARAGSWVIGRNRKPKNGLGQPSQTQPPASPNAPKNRSQKNKQKHKKGGSIPYAYGVVASIRDIKT